MVDTFGFYYIKVIGPCELSHSGINAGVPVAHMPGYFTLVFILKLSLTLEKPLLYSIRFGSLVILSFLLIGIKIFNSFLGENILSN